MASKRLTSLAEKAAETKKSLGPNPLILAFDLGTKTGLTIHSGQDHRMTTEYWDMKKYGREGPAGVWRAFRTRLEVLLDRHLKAEHTDLVILYEDVVRFAGWQAARRYNGLLAILQMSYGPKQATEGPEVATTVTSKYRINLLVSQSPNPLPVSLLPVHIGQSKRVLTGDGQASKAMVAREAKSLYPQLQHPLSEDESDSLAIYHWWSRL